MTTTKLNTEIEWKCYRVLSWERNSANCWCLLFFLLCCCCPSKYLGTLFCLLKVGLGYTCSNRKGQTLFPNCIEQNTLHSWSLFELLTSTLKRITAWQSFSYAGFNNPIARQIMVHCFICWIAGGSYLGMVLVVDAVFQCSMLPATSVLLFPAQHLTCIMNFWKWSHYRR